MSIILDFVIYAIPDCPFCDKAKKLLDDKHISYEYIILHNPVSRKRIGTKYNMNTAPIILYKKNLIGGYTELENYFSEKISQTEK